MTKPSRTPLNKATGEGEKRELRERTQVQSKRAKLKVGHKQGGIKTNHVPKLPLLVRSI
jgi:hypothetical protein